MLVFSRGLLVAVSQGDFVFFGKNKKLISKYSVLSARKTEGNQVAFFNPSQNGYFAHTAVPSNRAGGQILWVVVLQCVVQVVPP